MRGRDGNRYFMDIVVKMKFVDDGEEIKNYIN